MIDSDSSYLPLGGNTADQQARYRLFVEQGVPTSEQSFLAEACQRNQLSGHTSFDKIKANEFRGYVLSLT